MSRAVLLGTGGFPLILRLWLECFKIWQDEVDVCYIAVDNWTFDNKEYTENLVKQFPKVKLIDVKKDNPGVGWPQSYKVAYKQSTEDTLLIMHDDTLVYKKGIVNKYFKIAEKGKVVTQQHLIYNPNEVVDKAINKKYGWDNPPYSFLLYFLFITREHLAKTSMNFNAIGWNVGDDIPLLDIKNSPTTIGGDTGFLLGLELFEAQVPFHFVPRSETGGLTHKTAGPLATLKKWKANREEIFKEGWLHLQNTGNTLPAWFTDNLDTKEFTAWIEEVRLAWLYVMMRVESFEEIPEFKKKAQEVFDGVLLRCNGDIDRIKEIANIFNNLLFKKGLE